MNAKINKDEFDRSMWSGEQWEAERVRLLDEIVTLRKRVATLEHVEGDYRKSEERLQERIRYVYDVQDKFDGINKELRYYKGQAAELNLKVGSLESRNGQLQTQVDEHRKALQDIHQRSTLV